MDGANLNAQVGLTKAHEVGADVIHISKLSLPKH